MLSTHHRHKSASRAADHLNEMLDEALKATFPASDPVAISVEAEAAPHWPSAGAEPDGSHPES